MNQLLFEILNSDRSIKRRVYSLSEFIYHEDAIFEYKSIYFFIESRPTVRQKGSHHIDYYKLCISQPGFNKYSFQSVDFLDYFDTDNSYGISFNADNSEIMRFCDLLIIKQLHII